MFCTKNLFCSSRLLEKKPLLKLYYSFSREAAKFMIKSKNIRKLSLSLWSQACQGSCQGKINEIVYYLNQKYSLSFSLCQFTWFSIKSKWRGQYDEGFIVQYFFITISHCFQPCAPLVQLKLCPAFQGLLNVVTRKENRSI